MKVLKFLFCVFFISSFSLLLAQEGTKRILFVGNSYTYQWNLPQHVAAMGHAADKNLYIRQSTAGGATWGQHWRGEKNLKTLDKIRTGDYDIVVLQNHSLRPIEALDSMMHYGNLLHEEITKSGAKALLYMTWAREWNPLMIDQVEKGYLQLGDELNVDVVPIGKMWQKSYQLRPDLKLHGFDMHHQSATGIYLNACAFYRAITGESPVGLPSRLTTEDKNGETIYLNIQNPNDVAFMQQLVDGFY